MARNAVAVVGTGIMLAFCARLCFRSLCSTMTLILYDTIMAGGNNGGMELFDLRLQVQR